MTRENKLTSDNLLDRVHEKVRLADWVLNIFDEMIESNWKGGKDGSATIDGTIFINRVREISNAKTTVSLEELRKQYADSGFHIDTESHRNEIYYKVTIA